VIGHSPNQRRPHSLTPNQRSPHSLTPNQRRPHSLTPNQRRPHSLTYNQRSPHSLTYNQRSPRRGQCSRPTACESAEPHENEHRLPPPLIGELIVGVCVLRVVVWWCGNRV
jgi:hypothetical protein